MTFEEWITLRGNKLIGTKRKRWRMVRLDRKKPWSVDNVKMEQISITRTVHEH